MTDVTEAKALICEMCRNFYAQGWVSGTGGGMSIKVGNKIVMAPSGVQKERMQEEDMFLLSADGSILESPQPRPPPHKPPKLSECSPLFMAAYELRGAGAVLHSHSMNAVMATLLPGCSSSGGDIGEFRVTQLEMIKGIAGHGYFDECVVPVIENTARECELTASLRQAIARYPRSHAVLVRRHGVYVWGESWAQAKTQAECYEYLFEAAVKLRTLGIDVSKPAIKATRPAGGLANGHAEGGAAKKAKLSHARLPTAIVLDIEGTIAPMSFVSDTLFPYARQHLAEHLRTTFGSAETRADIQLLRAEAATATDQAGISRPNELAAARPDDEEATIAAAIHFVETLMAEDKKSTGLKALQGHIWRRGFESGELKGQLFEDVQAELRRWHERGIKVYIYSSGSREAQKNLFAHTRDGDLRPYLAGFFDTVVGPKIAPDSYREIALSIGADTPADILFATDNAGEAEAARTAGWEAVLVARPGNAPLPDAVAGVFRVISSMADLLA